MNKLSQHFTYLCSGIILSLITLSANAQESSYLDEVKTLAGTIETLYAVISGEKGEERDWQLFRYIFHPDAKLIPSRKLEDGTFQARYMTVEEYVSGSGKWLVENGFFEKEIHQVVNSFGSVTQVFSTYESYS